MIGLPKSYNSKEDFYHAVDYVNRYGKGKAIVLDALNDLKTNVFMNVLKESSYGIPAEEQTPDDYELVENPNCKKNQLGFTDADIEYLIKKLG